MKRALAALLTVLLLPGLAAAAEPARDAPPAAPAGAAASADLAGAPASGPTFAEAEVERLAAAFDADAADPRALLHIYELRRLMDDTPDLARLRQVLARAAVRGEAHPEVRAYARWTVASVEWRRGRRPKAKRWMRGLGTIDRMMLVGPFDNEGGSGYDRALPPELEEAEGRAPDPEATYQGKERQVRWRPLPQVHPLGWTDLGWIVQPSSEVVVYLRFVLESDQARDAVLHLGTPGATKVFQGGRLIHTDAADHPARFDQNAVAVRLERGPNAFLVKLTQREGALGAYLRVVDPDGRVLRGVRELDPSTGGGAAGAEPVGPAPETVLSLLQKRAQSAPASARAQGDLARALALRHPFDRTDRLHRRAARKALELASDDAAAAEYAFLVSLFEDDANRRRLALEEALRRDPSHLPARVELAMHHLGRADARQAIRELRAVVSAAPAHVGAQLALADAEGRAGFEEDEWARIRALARAQPLAPRVLVEEASLERRHGRIERAVARLRVGVGLYPGDRGLRSALVSALLDLGKVDEATAHLREQLEFAPGDLYARLRLADLLSANDGADEADALYARAGELAPDFADVWIRRARHHLRHGRRAPALEALTRAQAVAPQSTEVADLRRHLSEDGDDFAAPWRRDLRTLVEAAGEPPEGEDARTLVELNVVRVHPSGLSSTFHQEVHQILTRRGVEKLRAMSVAYTPGDQDLRIEQARVLKADGTIMQARGESERSLSEPWYRLYYDRRARIVSFPDLSPGDVVELVWRRDDVASANMFGDYFGELTFLQGIWPRETVEYVLLGPPGRTFHYNEPELPEVERHETEGEGGGKVLRWTATDVPKVVPEPGMPGWSEAAAYLHVSTYADWAEVASWWWGLVHDQLVPTPELQRLAQELVADLPEDDVRGRVAAIHNHVVKKTRYVGLEFGIHGFKPYRVDRIYERRFGDCKDKASLMYALLQAVGIDSQPVILRMRRLGRIPEYPASLAVFNHAILYVPSLDLWLDGTAEFSGTGELPAQDRGAAVLVVDPKNPAGSHFGYVPHPDPDTNVSSTEIRFTLSPDGAARAAGVFSVEGTAAPSYRQAYQTEEKRRVTFEQSWSQTYPGARVLELDWDGLQALEQDVGARFQLEVPRLAVRRNGHLVVNLFGDGKTYAERYAPLSSRHHDLTLGFPFTTRFRYVLDLPEGLAPSELPEPVTLDAPHGRFRLSWQREGAQLVVSGELALTAARVEAGAYGDFRSFLGKVDRAMQRKLRLVEAAGGTAGADADPAPAPAADAEPAADSEPKPTSPTAAADGI